MLTVLHPDIYRPYYFLIAYSKDETKVSKVTELNYCSGRLAIWEKTDPHLNDFGVDIDPDFTIPSLLPTSISP